MTIESKTLLAKLMATENLIVEQRKVSTAFFDTVKRLLVVPILDNDIPSHTYDLFMGHEVGHALWTPSDGHLIREKRKISHTVANIVEDSRIERKIKCKYPGLKSSFIKGYKDLIDRNFFGTQGIDVNQLNFIDRINLHCKGGTLFNIKFTESEEKLLKEVETTETYDDVLKVCEKLQDFLLEQKNNSDSEQFDGENEEESDDNYEFVEEDGENDDFSSELDESLDLGDDGNANLTDEIIETEKNTSYNDSNDFSENKDIPIFNSYTENSYRNNEHKLFSNDSSLYTYVNVPKIDLDRAILDYKELYSIYDAESVEMKQSCYDSDSFQILRNEISSGVSYLVKEFEMRKSADQYKRSSIAKTGELNMKKIYSHSYNEDIFKKMSVVPGAKSHGLVIFLDWSGSMHSHIQNTIKQLFNIVLFCKKVNIPYEVYAFTCANTTATRYVQERIVDDILLNDFKLMNILSSRMSSMEFSKAASALMYTSNGYNSGNYFFVPRIFEMQNTPLNESIMSAMELVPKFQKKNNLQIVNTIFLTDGEGDKSHYKYDSSNRFVNLSNYDYMSSCRQTCILRDPVTKQQAVLDGTSSPFIKLFKERTKCNIIGFYILSPNEFRKYVSEKYERKGINTQNMRSEFSKNHYSVIYNSGFDEYYLLRSKKGDNIEDQFTVKENSTTKGLVSAFSKFNNKRNTNRVILNRFINLIT